MEDFKNHLHRYVVHVQRNGFREELKFQSNKHEDGEPYLVTSGFVVGEQLLEIRGIRREDLEKYIQFL